MNKFRILAITLFAMLATTAAWTQDDYETTSIDDETQTEVIDSKQYNKWANSKNFKLGVQMMNKVIETSEEENNELEPYETAASLFKKELKQHPKNGYAKCNLAICESHVANITVNKFLVDVFNGEAELPIPDNVSDEDRMELLQAYYLQLMDNKLQAIKQTLNTLDEGIAMIPAADKDSRCKALQAKSEILKDNDFDDEVQEACLIEATKVHPCDNSYLNLLYFYSERNNTEKVEKYAQEAETYLPDNAIVQTYMAACAVKAEDYDKALKIINQLIDNNPDDTDLLKMRASTLTHAKRYSEAVDNLVKMANADALDDVYTPLAAIATTSDENLNMVLDAISKQEQHQFSEELPMNWALVEAMMHNNITHDYNKALECTKKAIQINDNVSTLMFLADVYYKLGDVNKALYILDVTAVRDEENDDVLKHKIEMEMNCGMADRVITDSKVQSFLGNSDLMPFSYSCLGWALSAKGDWKNAIDYYEQWAKSEEENITPIYYKARALVLAGQANEGREILDEILASHDFDGNEELKMNVLYYLGRTAESQAILDRLTANTKQVMAMTSEEIDDAEQLPEVMSLYNLACAHSLHGNSDLAMSFLKQHYEGSSDDALNYGYTILDYDFDNVRQIPEFLNIINEFQNRWFNGQYKPAK